MAELRGNTSTATAMLASPGTVNPGGQKRDNKSYGIN